MHHCRMKHIGTHIRHVSPSDYRTARSQRVEVVVAVPVKAKGERENSKWKRNWTIENGWVWGVAFLGFGILSI